MISSVLFGLAHVTNIVLNLATLVLLVSVAVSWFDINRYNPIVSKILYLSDTMCRPFRPLSRKIPGPFDFSPMFAMLVLVFLQKAIPTYLMALSYQLR